ncbi:Secretory carrier-associated membrane protein 1, partial [Pseudolycoriella hygida]
KRFQHLLLTKATKFQVKMDKFDENPFGEPNIDNPFADPVAVATTPVRSNAVNQAIVVLDDYHPFEDEKAKPNKFSGGNVAQQQQSQIPAYNQSRQAYGTQAVPQISTAELQRQQEELERRAADIERREAELRRSNTSGVRRNNWPPLPEKCCFQPCFYQDIAVEIPIEFQKIVRQLYYLWMFYALIMCTNILGGMILMFHSGEFATFGLAIMYAFLFTPLSFMCWYRPAYKAFRSDSSFNFMVFFFIFFFQMILLVIQTIGIPKSGYCGFITAISQFDGSARGIIVGLLLLIIAISFASATAGNVMLLTKIHSIYRHSDTVSMGKAQAEFTNEFIHNQHVQRAAANATAAA